MKYVLNRIARRKADYRRLPFFEFLRDDTRSVTERLSFFPGMSTFILDFGDLNRYVLRDESSSDSIQELINEHTREDDHHWPWYLEDLRKLGYDLRTYRCELYKQLYSDERRINRLLTLRLSHLIWNSPPDVRLAIVEAIEETGNVLFKLTAALARDFQRATGMELRYCGDFHLQKETGHAMNADHAFMALIELDEASRQQALDAVDSVFRWFEEWTEELLRFALNHARLVPESEGFPDASLNFATMAS